MSNTEIVDFEKFREVAKEVARGTCTLSEAVETIKILVETVDGVLLNMEYLLDWQKEVSYKQGLEDGGRVSKADNEDSSYKSGFRSGYENGESVGYDLGYSKGFKDGCDVGYEEGYSQNSKDVEELLGEYT